MHNKQLEKVILFISMTFVFFNWVVCAFPAEQEMPGWPKDVSGLFGGDKNIPAVCDINNDGFKEIIIGTTEGKVYVWDYKGDLVPGWPVEVMGSIKSRIVVGDIVSNDEPLKKAIQGSAIKKNLEIVALVDCQIEVRPHDLLYVWNSDGSLVQGYPKYIEEVVKYDIDPPQLVLGNLDQDSEDEIVFYSGEALGLYVINQDENMLWPKKFADGEKSIGTVPVVADLNGDLKDEIILHLPVKDESSTVYIFDNSGSILTMINSWENFGTSPAVGDLDGDGIKDIIWADHVSYTPDIPQSPTICVNVHSSSDGINWTPKEGWPVYIDDDYIESYFAQGPYSPIVLADIDMDSDLEIIITTLDGYIVVLHHDGSFVSGWPIKLPGCGGFYENSPSIGDVNGNENPEVVIGDEGFFIFDNKGQMLDDLLPGGDGSSFFSTPVLSDIDKDGYTEVIAASNKKIHVWKTEGIYKPENIEWPEYRSGLKNRGEYIFRTRCVTGKVFYISKIPEMPIPIPNANVSIISQDGLLKKKALTDEKGEYKIPKLPPGWYWIIAFDDYKMGYKKVYINAGSKPINVNIYLYLPKLSLYKWN